MPSYDMTGHIKEIGDVQTFPSGFSKREVVVCDDGERFPQDIAFTFAKDRARALDAFAVGDQVKVSFDIRGREYNGRHFVDLSGWKIEKADAAGSQSPAAGMPAAAPAAAPAPAVPPPMNADIDNIPF